MKTAPSLIAGLLISVAVARAQEQPSQIQTVPVPTEAALPHWPKLSLPTLSRDAGALRSGQFEVLEPRDASNAFVVRVEGKPVAVGAQQFTIGYVIGGQLRWFDFSSAAGFKREMRAQRNSLRVTGSATDPDGGIWKFERRFSPGAKPGTLDLDVQVTVDKDRAVTFLPMLMVFPGVGSFGQPKGQGLVAGLEYLENEPSSSEADVIGPAARRQVPDNLKLTFPLMVVQAEGRYVGLTWRMRPVFAALFDSPDRLFGSGGHVMGLLFPGSDGKNREEGSLLPRSCEWLHPGQPVVLSATLAGGQGSSVVPAIQQYVALRGLPQTPASGYTFDQYVGLAAGGWLDSHIREGSQFHHAIAGGSFPLAHVADAAVWMDWLAGKTQDSGLANRLSQTARQVIEGVAPVDYNIATIGHVRDPVASLLYGHVRENAAHAEEIGRGVLARFEPDGSLLYHPQPGGPDYGKTHFSHEANGLTSRSVVDLLEAAAFSGNRDLLKAAVEHLRAMDKFHDGVPRGAQTWECPLHTPDILASAQMVRAYTLGYELTGEAAFLDQAKYWAWTGVPFVYLVNPTQGAVGLYSTIAVFGATQWRAPVWLGLPVQWCGLVYADALYRLDRLDRSGPWKRLADGITASGIQQTWPRTDTALQGLLPDSFVLREQKRNGPAINPATVQACAVRYFEQPALCEHWCFRKTGLIVHAPGPIVQPEESAGGVSFQVTPWIQKPYFVLVNGVIAKPKLLLDGKPVPCAEPHQFVENQGWLVLKLEGRPKVEINLSPKLN